MNKINDLITPEQLENKGYLTFSVVLRKPTTEL